MTRLAPQFSRWTEMFAVLLLITIPFLLLLLYTGMRVETAILRREIRNSIDRRDELVRKNTALRNEVAELSGNVLERLYWKRNGLLPFYVKNRVVNIRMPDNSRAEETAARME